jgi:hypothetical protein
MAAVEKVIKRECDKPMAEKKGYLPCDENCKTCLACIETLSSGDRQHFGYKYGKGPVFK